MSIKIDGPVIVTPMDDEYEPSPRYGWEAPAVFFVVLIIVGAVLALT